MAEKASVLVVDDDANFLNTMAKILGVKGYAVTKAENGLRALELVRGGAFDAVLMDIKMPVMGGVEACKEIKKINPELAVILMTAFFAGEVSENTLEKGVYAVVVKPFDVDRVIRLVDEIVLRKRTG